MTLATAAAATRTRYGGPATIPAVLFMGAIGLGYWALFSGNGLLGKSRTPYIAQVTPASVYAHDTDKLGAPNTGGGGGTGDTSQSRFMAAIAQVESGGSYTARNKTTGAYGKYQILPSVWTGWARKWLGNANAPMSPVNQEIVAQKQMAYYKSILGDWRLVAAAWYAGGSVAKKAPWTWGPRTRAYVNKVSAILGLTPPKYTAPV